ncbi:MAG: ATP-dependent DNA helicase [Candidatus Saccharimonas sp.]
MSFDARYRQLNEEQQSAVDAIDGPLLVIAGPGTGKTELLSMRVANILKKTDTAPESILCLTFTDSGVSAMRARLVEIIGSDAYKVAIHTFHSFGTEIINQNREYFYNGANFQPADDIARREILTEIFDSLDYSNPLASKMNDDYTHMSDATAVISELKKAGLTSDELIAIIGANEATLDTVEKDLAAIFADKISLKMLDKLTPLAERIANLPTVQLPLGVTPLASVLALGMAHAFAAASETTKTNPITAWRNQWLEKDVQGNYVFKDRKRHTKLRSLAYIYFSYLSKLEHAGLYDYDDMILNVVHAIELYPDLRYNLQEKFHYFLVDEFQDTNLAQLRIIFNLTLNNLTGAPNIMAVGDDDQAIYSFQGADVSNIHRFREAYPDYRSVVLHQNYRSSQIILDNARKVIIQGQNRLESTMQISKELTANRTPTTKLALIEHPTIVDERQWLARSITKSIANGTKPSDIAVIARRHSELIDLLPYLTSHDIAVNYERRQNVLTQEPIQTLELMADISVAIFGGDPDTTDSFLPDLLSHPMFGFKPIEIWRLSIRSYKNRTSWLESMLASETFAPLANWLIIRAQAVPNETLENFIDVLIGAPDSSDNSPTSSEFRSPYFNYYFSKEVLADDPDAYISTLEALRALRAALRDYHTSQSLHIADFLECVHLYREAGASIMSTRGQSANTDNSIHLLSAHKSKGLEFNNVYVIGSVDSSWGEQARGRSRLISYPENMQIAPAANSYDERLRLYYVAMTRAKDNLTLSYASMNDSGKSMLPASLLVDLALDAEQPKSTPSLVDSTKIAEIAWHERVINQPTKDMKSLLLPQLESYKLSATHLNSFIDVSRGGPQDFLIKHMLHFPSAKSASASFGSAIHRALQRAHTHLITTKEPRPTEDILGDFIHELAKERLDESEIESLEKRGSDSLRAFLASSYASFKPTQKTELSFAHQGVQIGDARLTGSLDLLDVDGHNLTVTDYKTGKPSRDWKGKTDFEKIKLHRYQQQLMFYQLLCANSRDYSKYEFDSGILQFVEPDRSGEIYALEQTFRTDELERFSKLIQAVWRCVINLDFPDTSEFSADYKGVLAFEDFLIDKYS